MILSIDINDFGKVAVVMGGTSAERAISLLSGAAIYDALIQSGVDAVIIDSKEPLQPALLANQVERVFIALHGRDGEDGTIQGFFKMQNIPFTGSDMASSALAMNKLHCKQIWCQLNLNTADFSEVKQQQLFTLEQANKMIEKLGEQLFVKPIREGSSVGMSKVASVSELMTAIKKAQQFDHVLIEKYIEGKEYTVTILNGKCLPSISMVTPNEFYDYEAKYNSTETQYFCPSGLSKNEETELQRIALTAFNAIGCSGWGRVDFIRDSRTDEFQLLEVNTVPGMTTSSLVPKAAKTAGIDFSQLVLTILGTSLQENHYG